MEVNEPKYETEPKHEGKGDFRLDSVAEIFMMPPHQMGLGSFTASIYGATGQASLSGSGTQDLAPSLMYGEPPAKAPPARTASPRRIPVSRSLRTDLPRASTEALSGLDLPLSQEGGDPEVSPDIPSRDEESGGDQDDEAEIGRFVLADTPLRFLFHGKKPSCEPVFHVGKAILCLVSKPRYSINRYFL